MENSLDEIKAIISKVLAEAKKKKEKSDKAKKEVHPAGYSYAEALDFSAALGAYNLYRSQGAVNWGPMTGAGTHIDDKIAGGRAESNSILRSFIKEAIRQEMTEEASAWNTISKKTQPKQNKPKNIWEAAESMLAKASKK